MSSLNEHRTKENWSKENWKFSYFPTVIRKMADRFLGGKKKEKEKKEAEGGWTAILKDDS